MNVNTDEIININNEDGGGWESIAEVDLTDPAHHLHSLCWYSRMVIAWSFNAEEALLHFRSLDHFRSGVRAFHQHDTRSDWLTSGNLWPLFEQTTISSRLTGLPPRILGRDPDGQRVTPWKGWSVRGYNCGRQRCVMRRWRGADARGQAMLCWPLTSAGGRLLVGFLRLRFHNPNPEVRRSGWEWWWSADRSVSHTCPTDRLERSPPVRPTDREPSEDRRWRRQ